MSRLQYDEQKQVITVPEVTGVEYRIGGEPVTGDVHIDEDTIVTAVPTGRYKFPEGAQARWTFKVPQKD